MGAPSRFFAPGRINIIGEHTDHSGGYVMPGPLVYGIRFEEVRTGDSWHVLSETTKEFFRGDPLAGGEGSPALRSFLSAVVDTARLNGLQVTPLQGVLRGDLPPGSGLSSSTALTSVLLAAQHAVNRWTLSRTEMMWLAQQTEQIKGIQCGIMDQFCMWQGTPGKAVLLDCTTLDHREVSLDIPDYQWTLIISGVKHELYGSPYNERREQLYRGISDLEQWGFDQTSLKRPGPVLFDAIGRLQDPVCKRRVGYVARENQRVLAMEDALHRRDAAAVSSLLNRGQDGLQLEYEVSCPEIDTLVSLFRERFPGAGIRMVGGGFGGALIAFHNSDLTSGELGEFLYTFEKTSGKKGIILPLMLGETVSLGA